MPQRMTGLAVDRLEEVHQREMPRCDGAQIPLEGEVVALAHSADKHLLAEGMLGWGRQGRAR
jgi:hypothetical protein